MLRGVTDRPIEEPWTDPSFVDAIAEVQRQRQLTTPAEAAAIQVYDRSPLCTLALARYLGRPVTLALAAEVERVARERSYDRRVFFVRPLGFVTPTAARRITFAESLVFERLHEEAYGEHGYELVDIPAAPVAHRVAMIEQHIRSWSAATSPAEAPGPG